MSIIFQKLKAVADFPLHHPQQANIQQPQHKNIQQPQQRKVYSLKKKKIFSAGFFAIASVISLFVIIIFIAIFFIKPQIDSGADNAVDRGKSLFEYSQDAALPNVENRAYAPDMNSVVQGNIILPGAETASVMTNSIDNTGTGSIKSKSESAELLKSEQAELKSGSTLEIRKKAGNNDNTSPGHNSLTAIHEKTPPLKNAHAKLRPVLKYGRKKSHAVIKHIRKKSHLIVKHAYKKSHLYHKTYKKKLYAEKNNAKAPSIEKLAADLNEAFMEKNKDKTDKLLAKLIHIILLKKNKSNYYLKLMAFKEIRKARYDSAKRFLIKVLEKNKDDFEAGVNMAVIEIRQNHYISARKRLIKLKQLYPSSVEIDTLLNRLQGFL